MTTNRKSAEEWVDNFYLNHVTVEKEWIQQIITSERNAAFDEAAKALEAYRIQGDWQDVDVFQKEILALKDKQ